MDQQLWAIRPDQVSLWENQQLPFKRDKDQKSTAKDLVTVWLGRLAVGQCSHIPGQKSVLLHNLKDDELEHEHKLEHKHEHGHEHENEQEHEQEQEQKQKQNQDQDQDQDKDQDQDQCFKSWNCQ